MPGRLRELDLLRFVAAVAVLLHHFTGVRYYTPWDDATKVFPGLARITGYGYLGVQLFFVISGFVILMSAWDRRLGDFAISRFTRLFPAYWFSIVLALGIFLLTGLSSSFPVSKVGPIERILPNLTMLQTGIGAPDTESVYWTLWVELHFYALFTLLLWARITYKRCVLFMAGWLLACAFALEAGHKMLIAILVPMYAPYFVAGMAFFLLYRYGQNVLLWLFVSVCWALGVYYGVRYVSPMTTQPQLDNRAIPFLITAIFLVMAMVAVGHLRWLRWRGLTVLGALTYPLYLVHQTVSRPLITVLHGRVDRWVVLGMAVAASLAAAFLIHRYVESPLQGWLRTRLRAALAQVRADLPRMPAAGYPRRAGDPAWDGSRPTDRSGVHPDARGPAGSAAQVPDGRPDASVPTERQDVHVLPW